MSSWFLGDPRPDAVARLYVFPHAGGGAAAFSPWRSLAGRIDVRPVQYPGRENRVHEASATNVEELADGVTEAILRENPPACALFGHSMGGTVAFEVGRRLVAAGVDLRHLIVSAALPPQSDLVHELSSTMSDAELIDALRRLGGVPEELFHYPDLLEVVMDTFRADLVALDTYRFRPGSPLPCPITAFVGTEDAGPARDHATAWRQLTAADFALRLFPGGHFYLWEASAQILDGVEELMAVQLEGGH